ncbi:MAG: Fic family protein [Magnetococcales bacterium]|nr:Fic family protein [Magnetococcales bacterium]
MKNHKSGMTGSPYSLDPPVANGIFNRISKLEERVELLRGNGILSPSTLKKYYGEKRFEQVAASNALEGSTLSAGETELAILKGVTITGHDPAYVRDALALDNALRRLVDIAQDKNSPTSVENLKELHTLILVNRSGAGIFRTQPLYISGSRHRPPETWHDIISAMKVWEGWSERYASLAAPIRAIVLHAWLAHIHPFIDGNGRTARAIGNLELVRAGYPPVIIKKKERSRYLDSLGDADEGGNLQDFFEFMLEQMEGSLVGLELSAHKEEGYDALLARLRQEQKRRLEIWMTQVKFLALNLAETLQERISSLGGKASLRFYEDSLDLDDYIALSQGRSVSRSWSFTIAVDIPSFRSIVRLAWFGFRSPDVIKYLHQTNGPALYWSVPNPEGSPRWITDTTQSPQYVELTLLPEDLSQWVVRDRHNAIEKISPAQLINNIVKDLLGFEPDPG